jgi:tryptophanyl-tRNA synthetase
VDFPDKPMPEPSHSLSTGETPRKKTVMSGMRPTGKLHLGHYMGVLKNWVALQDEYTCYFSIADWHALTTQYDRSENIQENIHQMALDWLSCGIAPEKATFYVQSAIPEIAVMHLLMSMLTPVKWLETDPTLKDMVAMLKEDLSYGLLGYPTLQTMDILGVLGELVPVGKDQLAHLEISRDLARRFNHQYQTQLFPEPRPLLTEVPLLLGLDGRKMGKSFDNAIFLSDSADVTQAKIKTAVTDKNRVKRQDPGNPQDCEVVFPYYQVFADEAARNLADKECRTAERGCMDCKKILTEWVNETLRPIRERRAELEKDPETVRQILKAGNEHSRQVHQETLRQMKAAMRLA